MEENRGHANLRQIQLRCRNMEECVVGKSFIKNIDPLSIITQSQTA